jgi:hypothetical protein
MSNIKLNAAKLKSAINGAFDVAVEALGDSFQDAIAADIYEWPRETQRSNGEVVGSPRDAVDEEELIDSLVVSRTANSAEYEWQAPHASIVHDGATTKNGTELPARPWTEVALRECDVAEIMQQQLNKRL